MFHTSPDDESHFPFSLDGSRSWSRFEIELNLPFFIVAIREVINSEKDAPSFVRTIISGQVEDVLKLANQQNDVVRIQSVALMSPGYLNQTTGYQYGHVQEIWESEANGGLKFVLTDGSSLTYPETTTYTDMKLVFRL